MRPILLKNNLELQVFELQTEAKNRGIPEWTAGMQSVSEEKWRKNRRSPAGRRKRENSLRKQELRAVQGADVKIDGNDTVITMKAGEFVCEV